MGAQTSDTVGLLKFYDGKKKYCLGYDPKEYVKAIENCAPCLEGSCRPKPYLHWVLTGKGKQARIKTLPFENTRNHMSRPQCLQRSGLGEGEPIGVGGCKTRSPPQEFLLNNGQFR